MDAKKTENINGQVAENLTNGIVAEAKIEEDARRAKALMDDFIAWQNKVQLFIKETGNPPQDSMNFLRNVILTYGAKKLESKIITL